MRWLILFLSLLLLVGCGGSDPTAPVVTNQCAEVPANASSGSSTIINNTNACGTAPPTVVVVPPVTP